MAIPPDVAGLGPDTLANISAIKKVFDEGSEVMLP
jgi:hypothetical protein